MANIQLFAQKQGETGFSSYYELDLYKEEPIKITKSVEDLVDPQKTASNFSRTFRVPNTSVNGQFFKAVFNVNSIDFDATQKADAYINVNGTYFISGNIRITQIFRNDSQGKIEYELIFMGETSNFASIVGPKDLSDLNLNQYAHTITYAQIQYSWLGTLFGGDIVYPLAEWGYTYTSGVPDQNTLSRYDGNVSLYGFTNSSFPLTQSQFKPAIRAKAVWDKIFEEAGFTYESTFLDDDIFRNLYLISTNDSLPTQNEASQFEVEGGFQYLGPLSAPGVPLQLEFDTAFINTGNDFYLNTDKYIAPFSGQPYTFELELDLDLYPVPTTPQYITLVLQVNGVTVQTRTATYDSSPCQWLGSYTSPCIQPLYYNGTNTVIPFSVNLNAGDEVTVHLVKPAGFTTITTYDQRFRGLAPNSVNPSGLMPANYKQIDFLKGINDKFKLIWEPDPYNPKNFFIEPWKDWVAQGEQKDWTGKLNENKDISIQPRFYTQPRQLVFKDSNESDLYNFSYEQEYKEVFGELKQDSDIELITGSKDIKTIFAPVPLGPIANAKKFLIPHFAKDTEEERQPIQVKPRLMYYNGLQSAPYTWYMENDAGVATAQTLYPVFSQFDRYPFNTQAFDFNWTNVPQYWKLLDVTEAVGSGRTGKTAFGEFWAKWYNDTYSSYSRILEASFVLDLDDISQLRFNDLIYVKDAWYQPIKITDYVLGDKAEVRCQLLKLGTVGVNIQPGATGPGSGPTFYTYKNLCYDATDQCEAYCCENKTTYTIYTAAGTLASSGQWFMDTGLSVPALSGWYYDGALTYYISNNGQLQQIGTGSGCSCLPPTVSSKACTSTSFCTSCCCTSFVTDVYYNGTSLDTSTLAYADASYNPLVPGNWYRETGTNNSVQIGSDGVTIVQVGNCQSCICDTLVDDALVGTGDTSNANGATGSCCGTGTTGAFGFNDVYYDGPTWKGATGYYFDPFKLQPVGGTGSMYLSDGETWKNVTAGSPGATGACPDPQSGACPGKSKVIATNMENASPTNTEMVLTYETSPDGINWYYNGQQIASGNSFNNGYTPVWDPTHFWRMKMFVDPLYGGTVSYSLYKNGNLIHIDGGTSTFPFYTLEYGPIGTDNYDIDFAWVP